MPESLMEVLREANNLVDRGMLTKPDERVITSLLMKYDRGHKLDGKDVSQLREVIERNED